MISPILNALGLMKRSEHEELIENSVTYHLRNYRSLERHRDDLKAECAALRHDANMWRNSLKRSRDRKKGVGK